MAKQVSQKSTTRLKKTTLRNLARKSGVLSIGHDLCPKMDEVFCADVASHVGEVVELMMLRCRGKKHRVNRNDIKACLKKRGVAIFA